MYLCCIAVQWPITAHSAPVLVKGSIKGQKLSHVLLQPVLYDTFAPRYQPVFRYVYLLFRMEVLFRYGSATRLLISLAYSLNCFCGISDFLSDFFCS